MYKESKQEKIKYFMYCRRSSDTEDRQVQSIDAQKRELGDFAKENGLEVIKIFEESQSAKAPGRPIFTEMVERINKGEAEGLLVWKLNRLARNPVDGGTVSWMLQQRLIKHIHTFGRSYYPEDNVIVMAVELGMANQYIRDLSTDTKRGMRERVERGYPSGVAPIGYLNDMSAEPGSRGWIIDKERFNLVRQMHELFHTGKYSIRGLMREANEKMGLRTPQHKKQGGKKLVLSYVTDTILKNPIYAGFFITKDGERHKLNDSVPRIISEELYWDNQKILGVRGRPRPYKNIMTFAYTGKTKCGTCGGSVTAEHKHQLICSNCKHKFSYSNKTNCPKCEIKIGDMKDPLYLHYIYYHCTKRAHPDCPEGCVQESYIDGYLSSYFQNNLKISKSLSDWCIENLYQLDTSEKNNESDKKVSVEKLLTQKEKEYQELVFMKTRGLLNDSEFISSKSVIGSEIETIRKELQSMNNIDPQRLKESHRAFDLAVGISEIFKNGTVEEKKSALWEIGSNLTLKEKKLNVSNTKLYSIIINGLIDAKTKKPQFEPEKIEDLSSRNEVFEYVRPTLLRDQGSNLGHPR